MTAFNDWLDTFIEEKGIDPQHNLHVEGPSGLNIMPIEIVVEAMKRAPRLEQASIKRTFVLIDFKNGNPVDFLKHLAQAIAR